MTEVPPEYTAYERGMWAEAVAIKWLEAQGYHVFLNVNGLAPYDLVGLKAGVLTGFDAKFVEPVIKGRHLTLSCSRDRKSPAQQAIAVKFIYVTPEGRCSYSLTVLANEERLRLGLDRDRVGAGRPNKRSREALALPPLRSLQ